MKHIKFERGDKMLDVAIKYKEQLEKLQYNIWFKDKYKF